MALFAWLFAVAVCSKYYAGWNDVARAFACNDNIISSVVMILLIIFIVYAAVRLKKSEPSVWFGILVFNYYILSAHSYKI